jgi:DNA-binding CsgD family transcriptional regulator
MNAIDFGAPIPGVGASAGVSELFSAAFTNSKNAMALVDSARRHKDVNGAYLKLLGYPRDYLIGLQITQLVIGGPLASPSEWDAALAARRFHGQAELQCADDGVIAVQWAGNTEVVSGHRLTLFVALNTSRWGERFRRTVAPEDASGHLSAREREVVRLVSHGSTGPEIADELGIAHQTVRTHVRNAMEKVGARSRAHLVAKALGDGLVLG